MNALDKKTVSRVNYTYKMRITSVYDGDSCRANCDLGFKASMDDLSLRVNRVDTPECRRSKANNIGDLHVKAGKLVRDWFANKVKDKVVVVQTFLDFTEKYGRWLAEIWVDDVNINDLMVEKGFAKPYFGGKKDGWLDHELKHIIHELETKQNME